MDKQEVQQYITTVIEKLGFTISSVEVTEEVVGTVTNVVLAEGSQTLIGQNGESLRALNYIVGRVHEKTGGDPHAITIDINGYHKNHITFLKNQAESLAVRVKELGQEIEMAPMNAYDRMVVHGIIKTIPGVKTQSVGEGKLRHIVISQE